ncbi:MAG: hypothetical protein GWP35_01335 [Proteobacteria bacterium]|nr:hypothetical protein [Pseudomonadota bacterium]
MNPMLRGCTAMPHSEKVSPVETSTISPLLNQQEKTFKSLLLLVLSVLLVVPGLPGITEAQDGSNAGETPVETETTEAAEPLELGGEFSMTEGSVPVLSLLRFIQRTTGKFVNYPSKDNDQAFAEEAIVEVLGDIDPLTYPVIKAILETNGYELWESTLEDGTVAINVRTSAPTARSTASVDPVNPIIGPEDSSAEKDGEELATLVLQLEHTTSAVVRQALQELLGIAGAGSASGSVKLVTITENETLLIKAEVRILEHIQQIVKYIDVEVTGPDHTLTIRELFYADAQSIVQIVTEALSDFSPTGTTGRRAVPTQGQRGGSANTRNSQSSALAGESTRLIADDRTQKILIQSTDGEELDLVHQLIDELDTKVRNVRNTTWIYTVNFLKAEELADNIRQLVEGSEGSLRRGSSSRTTSRTGRTGSANNGGVQQQQQFTPTRIVPHEQTNSLIIQAEPEEYEEIENILKQIDKRRRQVFLEVALVQVKDTSSLNYTLEFLAGNLDDQNLAGLLLSSFGASTVTPALDPNGIITGLTRTPGIGNGLSGVLQQDGQFPLIVNALKTDEDSNILATPFILADDNQENSISVLTDIFYTTSNTTNVNVTTSQQSESAGITLSLIPTISSEVVLLELELEVSAFAAVSDGTGALPDKTTNTVTSKVTIPDGGMFIIGGLAQMAQANVASKVPFLGDLPIIGTLFQSKGNSSIRDNLYVFLSAHIMDDSEYNNLGNFTKDAIEGVRSFDDDIRLQQFSDPDNQRDNDLLPLTKSKNATAEENRP